MSLRKAVIAAVVGAQVIMAGAIDASAEEATVVWKPVPSVQTDIQYEMFPSEIPESGRVPAVVRLLSSIPFYDKYEDSGGPPKGYLAPQEVQIVKAGMPWSEAHNWWKVRTWVGDKWINVPSNAVDVAPPKQVSLLDNTLMYANPNTNTPSTGTLAPQDVGVVAATKRWFAADSFDNSSMTWLQIHTTWLGDQWIRIPLNRIGTLLSIEPEKAYFMNETSITNSVGEITAEFVSPFNSTAYRVETENGVQWVFSRGAKIEASNEILKLDTRTTLFKQPNSYGEEAAILLPQSVDVFERIDNNPYGNAPGEWYHAHTSAGDGWVNKQFADPIDAKPTDVAIQLNSNAQLMSYPTSGTWYKFAQAAPQILHPICYWDDASGNRWYQIDSYVGLVWLKLNPYTDRIVGQGPDPAVEMSFFTLYYNSAKIDGDELKVQDRRVGFMRDNAWYVSIPFLSEGFRYDQSESGGLITYQSSRFSYGFRIQSGSQQAITLWNGKEVRQVNLKAAPQILSDGELYLSEADVRTLFGSLIAKVDTSLTFTLQAYNVTALAIPTSINSDQMELNVSFRDSIQQIPVDASPELRPKLTLEELGAPPKEAVQTFSKWVAPLQWDMALFQYSAVKSLKVGPNQLRARLEIGGRILWLQDFAVQRTK
ncbi:hypothetical protein [Paenibacillus sp. Soil787]|uniref:hypothetical protein n=1 Tax=Paenibacillus sp. Soil787 TaxID=1736411 RepID=UPI0007025FA7|nr:hypothetical protein [Paenibacillus sp. Soil787]KRF21777.1 hypothetical protein ASG93_30790 [Paenibacillus sp. Soil787]